MKSILFVPGYRGTVSSVIDQLRFFTFYYRVYAIEFHVDGRCYLKSITFNEDEVDYRVVRSLIYDHYFTWLDEALDYLGGDVVLCGCSFGAYLVLKYLEWYPNLDLSIVLICPFGLTRHLGPLGCQLACLFKCIFSICCCKVYGTREISEMIKCDGCEAYWDDEPIWNVIVKRKILLIYGEDDKVAPYIHGEFIQYQCPETCELEVITKMGHLNYGLSEESVKRIAECVYRFDTSRKV